MMDHQDHPMNTFDLSHIPVLFSGMDTFGRAQASFLETLTNIGDIDLDRNVCSRVNGVKKGEEEFCEALKVDVSKTKEKYFQASITNTVVLVSVLFEDFGFSQSGRITDESQSDNYSLDLNATLFNKSKELTIG